VPTSSTTIDASEKINNPAYYSFLVNNQIPPASRGGIFVFGQKFVFGNPHTKEWTFAGGTKKELLILILMGGVERI
jgi:hypothetical protein